MPENRREFNRSGERIEELVSKLESCGDAATISVAKELLQVVLELHAAALDQVVAELQQIPEGDKLLEAFAEDPLVSGVLSLHGIHPVAVEDRVKTALETARPFIRSHGGDVQLVSVDDNIVHVRFRENSETSSPSAEMKSAIENAVFNAAPEVSDVIAEPMPAPPRAELVIMREE